MRSGLKCWDTFPLSTTFHSFPKRMAYSCTLPTTVMGRRMRSTIGSSPVWPNRSQVVVGSGPRGYLFSGISATPFTPRKILLQNLKNSLRDTRCLYKELWDYSHQKPQISFEIFDRRRMTSILQRTLECYSPCIPTDFLRVTPKLKRRFATGSAFDRILFSFWEAWDAQLIRSGPYRVSTVRTVPTCVRGADPLFPTWGVAQRSRAFPRLLLSQIFICEQCYASSKGTRIAKELATLQPGY